MAQQNLVITARADVDTPAVGQLTFFWDSDNGNIASFKTSGGTFGAIGDGSVPASHAASHQNGGSDEINVASLSGLLADGQTPLSHAATHTNGTDDIQSATASQKGVATATQITKLDAIESLADVTDETNVVSSLDGATLSSVTVGSTDKVILQDVSDSDNIKTVTAQSIADLGTGMAFPEFQYIAGYYEIPNNADWVVNGLAPVVSDTNNNGINVWSFIPSAPKGIGFTIQIPSTATNLIISERSRAETTPAGSVNAARSLYNRGIPNNAAVQAFTAAVDLTDSPFTTNEFFQYTTQTIALSTLSITAGELTQFELVRDTDDAGDTLLSNWNLAAFIITFT